MSKEKEEKVTENTENTEKTEKTENTENTVNTENTESTGNTEAAENTEEKAAEEKGEGSGTDAARAEIDALKDKLMRHAAEFDNYKKRTQKEKEEMYKLAVSETVEKLLPVKDNLERALTSVLEADEKVAEGVKMIDKQFSDVLKEIGVEEIESVGSEFDPERHNAVMHEDNEDFGENIITEEFMKGYIYKEKVIRHSVVKVAN